MTEREAELVYRVQEWPYREGHKPTDFIKRVHALIGARGAVSFIWVPRPEDDTNIREVEARVGQPMWPLGMDVGYHRRERRHEWEYHHEECDVLASKTGCYYDGSSLRAQEWLGIFLRAGEDWLKAALRAYYALAFEDEPADDPVEGMGLGETLNTLQRLLGGDK